MPRESKDRGAGGVAAEMGVENPRLTRKPVRRVVTPVSREETTQETVQRELSVKPWPGRKFSQDYTRVRWCHGENRCWAFTVTRQAHQNFESGDPLSCIGATFPDGQPVVPEGTPPYDVYLRCGTCGTNDLEFLELRFFAE